MRKRKAFGFSMVELLVVMVLVAIALLGIMALQLANVASTGGNRFREMAVFLCKSELDAIQAYAQSRVLRLDYMNQYPDLAEHDYAGEGGGRTLDVDGRPPDSGKGPMYNLEWERVRAINTTSSEYLARVTWSFEVDREGNAIPRTVEFRRIIYLGKP